MAIINIPIKTLIEMAKFAILVEKKLHVRQKNMARYRPNNFDSEELEDNDDEDEHYKKRLKRNLRK
jgi:hypothetical protein